MVGVKAIRPDTEDFEHLSLPLHTLIRKQNNNLRSPVPKEAYCLRLLISLYPEAAGGKDGEGLSP